MKRNLLGFVFPALFALVLAVTARAEIFIANLTGAQEVPAVTTGATGYARIVLNADAGTISYTVVFSGLSSTQTASHIHTGTIGNTGAVTINFGAVGGTAGTISGSAAITAGQIATLRAHGFYVNVHSTNNPNGEIRGQLGIQRPLDYDGDGRTDFSVVRFPSGSSAPLTFWNLNSRGTVQNAVWGDANRDIPAPGDYDGDGKTDIAVYRNGANNNGQGEFWILRSSDGNVQYYAWGVTDDVPVQRDYDGDGITDAAVFRYGAAATDVTGWYIRNSSTGTVRIEAFGLSGDSINSSDYPIPGDYDGDGKFDLAVYRVGQAPNNAFIIKRSSDNAVTYTPFGVFSTDYVVPGDYDGDGKFDLAVVRSSGTLTWWVLQSSTGTIRTTVFGNGNSDIPMQGDYDGDGRTDAGVYREGATAGAQNSFWVFRSLDNTSSTIPWGVRGDFPVNRFDVR
ncbi:MAG: CHRD domain-containing protein [Acidobacteria bacterium]|nr:CHRD domain-containing protein [Acidobacteriota bacterium]